MRQCSALEFRSHAVTFSDNRRLLVTTVHFGACTGWKDRYITTFGLSVSVMANRNMKIITSNETAHLIPNPLVDSDGSHTESPIELQAKLSWHQIPSLATGHPGLVDPPCHAEEAPHLLEGDRRVPAANGMRTVQAQQV